MFTNVLHQCELRRVNRKVDSDATFVILKLREKNSDVLPPPSYARAFTKPASEPLDAVQKALSTFYKTPSLFADLTAKPTISGEYRRASANKIFPF